MLNQTVSLMNSENYKDRFIAEYFQTKERYDKLHKVIIQIEAGTCSFKPTCKVELLKQQAKAMGEYLYCLEVRAEIEMIKLSIPSQATVKGV